MTKKHFIALADKIKAHNLNGYDIDGQFNREQIISLADFCQAQNPQFDRERWLSYIAGTCGKSGGKVKVNA